MKIPKKHNTSMSYTSFLFIFYQIALADVKATLHQPYHQLF